ncbi:MAG TPA: alpha-amylase family glycosyl hydrolase, partial [Actinomycetota bacterium]|nr:alpha-amylase family glycosyl hydrolase [Actinomycetota bacterium]
LEVTERAWWHDGVVYQVYLRSFADTDGDGIGDLQGVIDHLDHLRWLGVEGIWLSPIHPSPNRDWGYDVADYLNVHPELGDLATMDRLVAEAGERDIRILLDLVPNHTSDRHAWFADSRSSREAAHRDWYVWADPGPGGSPPNNWLSVFGGPAWELDPATGQCYLHNFLPGQPDLNWWNREVRDAFDDIMRFWFDRGIAGFRIDVANGLIKDAELRDNPAPTQDDPPEVRRRGQRFVHNMNRPEVHDVYRRWRTLADASDRVLVGETWLFDPEVLATYYGNDLDELHLCFNFSFMFADLEAATLRAIVEATEASFPAGAQPAWTASNHDVGRFPSRWCAGDPARIRCSLMTLLTLRGTPFLYYGDEIGMGEVPIEGEDVRDEPGLIGDAQVVRDPGRTPMQWAAEPGAGFTRGDVRPWLPIGDPALANVADQRSDPDSTLHLCRDLIALRRQTPDLRSGEYASLPSPDGVWAWRRGEGVLVAVNLSGEAATLAAGRAVIAIDTDRARDGERVEGGLSLGPWEGAVLLVARA